MRPFHPLIPLDPGTALIEASAGTGKTYNLTNLCLRLVVEHGVPIDRVLLVTFTRAATAELKDRLRKRFVDAAAALDAAAAGVCPDEPVQRHLAWGDGGPHEALDARRQRLARAVRDVDAAAVFTIHGFCQRVLQEHALACGFDLTAELLEDTRGVLEDAVIDAHVALRHDRSPAELAFLDASRLRLGDLRTIARAVTHDGDAPIDPPGAYPDFAARHRALADRWAHDGAAAVAWVLARVDDGTLNRTSYRPDRVAAVGRALEAWLVGDGTVAPPALGLFTPSSLAAKVKKGRSLGADLPPILHAVEALDAALGPLADAASGAVARDLRARFERALANADAIGFDRLIRDVAEKVDDPALQRALRDRYHAALIDEFQDTDAAQWRIFHTLFGRVPDRRLILVGDPKQAIYAFRGADVRVYGAAREATPSDRRFTMTTNHRSDGPLVDALNALFHPATRPPGAALDAFGEPFIRYEPVDVPAHHRAPRIAAPGRAPVELRWFDAEDLGGDAGAAVKVTEATDALPGWIRDELRALLASGATIATADGPRPIAPGDVAVLVLTNRLAARVRDALTRGGVPAVVQQGEPVTASDAAVWFGDWLAAVASPSADAPLRRFAVSPLGGWSLPELYAALHADDPAAQDRWAGLCERVAAQARLFANRGFLAAWHALLATADDDGDPLDRIARTPGGERALTDLAHLAELLHAASASHPGPAALGAWLRAQRDEPDLDADALAQRLETDARAVQIVTIHKSKGLQYPIVLLPDLWRALSKTLLPTRVTPYHHPTPDGQELRLDATVDPAADPKAARLAAADDALRRERVRLLYVAMTRAQHHLVVWGGPHKDFGRSPLAALLAAHDPGRTDPVAEAEGLTGARDEVDALLGPAVADGHVAIRGLGGRSPAPASPAEDAAPPTAARYGRGAFDRAWRRLSFTGLTRTAAHGASFEADYDEVDAGAAAEPTAPVADEVPLAAFPRGREAGVYVHGIFEKIDFQTLLPRDGAPDLAALLRADARRVGLGDEGALDDLERALPTILATPLGGRFGDVALHDLAPTDRLDELSFDLPVCGGFAWRPGQRGITGEALAGALRGAAPQIPGFDAWLGQVAALQPDAVAGFLTGSIDLVGRVRTPEGARYFVADYKTNRLATPAPDDPVGRSTPADYAPGRLAAAMAEHHYFLQAALYLVALHRYLAHRVGPAYDYDRDVLGAAYLFVRGMSGAPGAGVIGFSPPFATIAALSALLDGGAR